MTDYPGFNGMVVLTREQVRDSGVIAVPGTCILTGDGEGPFLDTGVFINAKEVGGVDPYALISVQKVKDMARAVGMVEADEDRIAELEEKVAELEPKAIAWDAVTEAVPA